MLGPYGPISDVTHYRPTRMSDCGFFILRKRHRSHSPAGVSDLRLTVSMRFIFPGGLLIIEF